MVWREETHSDVLASPVTLLPPVDRSRPVDLKHSRQTLDDPVTRLYLVVVVLFFKNLD